MRVSLPAALVASALVSSWASPAWAQGACQSAAAVWVDGCRQREKLELELSHCPPAGLVVSVLGQSSLALKVEIAPASARSFRRAGGWGLSPIGEFADWSKEPLARRRALDQLAACLERDREIFEATGAPSPRRTAGNFPLLLFTALAVGLAGSGLAWFRRGRAKELDARDSSHRRAGQMRWAAGVVVAYALVLSVRGLLLPRAFFHQNGQGPLWVEFALGRAGALSAYGPGYREMFGALAERATWPDHAVFWAQALLGATLPLLAFSIMRSVGCPKPIAFVGSVLLALEPLMLRMAQSESYFGSMSALSFAAAAVLARGSLRTAPRSPSFLCALLISGLIVSQAVRVHPASLVAAALLPLVCFFGPGRLGKRLVVAATAALGIVVIVGLSSGRALHGVLSGELGRHWVTQSIERSPLALTPLALAFAFCLLFALLARRRARALLVASALATTIAIASFTNLLRSDVPWVSGAYFRQFLPVVLAGAGALAARTLAAPRRARLAAGLLAIAGSLFILASWRSVTRLPTDALEAGWAMEWRTRLPTGSLVYYVERSGPRIAALPLYAGSAVSSHRIALPGPLPALPEGAFYYRSSLCAQDQAAARCRELEQRYVLEPLETRELPALSSLPWLPVTGAPLPVGVYRIAGLRRPDER